MIEKPCVLQCFQEWGGLGVPCGRCSLFFWFPIVFTTIFSISDRIHDRFWSPGSLGDPWGVPEGVPGASGVVWGIPGGSLGVPEGVLGGSLEVPRGV